LDTRGKTMSWARFASEKIEFGSTSEARRPGGAGCLARRIIAGCLARRIIYVCPPLPAAVVCRGMDACYVVRDHDGQALTYRSVDGGPANSCGDASYQKHGLYIVIFVFLYVVISVFEAFQLSVFFGKLVYLSDG